MSDPKATAAKDKTQLQLLPPTSLAQTANVMALGASKYGAWNWRENDILCSTYVGAIKRHLDSWWDGETIDPESGESHIAHIAASCMILMDAQQRNKLINDRPQ